MIEQKTGFDGIDPAKSSEVFRDLSAGKAVTWELYSVNTGDFVENPTYSTLFQHRDHFLTLFDHIVYELVFSPQGYYFYLREKDDGADRDYNRNGFKVQAALVVIGRYFAHTGRDLKYLGSPLVGLKADDIQAIMNDDEYVLMLRSADFKDGLSGTLVFLKNRGFAFETGQDRFILSGASMHFLELLGTEYEAIGSETTQTKEIFHD